jgi:hypothetical protein
MFVRAARCQCVSALHVGEHATLGLPRSQSGAVRMCDAIWVAAAQISSCWLRERWGKSVKLFESNRETGAAHDRQQKLELG